MDRLCRRLRLVTRQFLVSNRRLVLASALILGVVLLIRWNHRAPRRKVDFYVVEEHHEVVRYWFHETVIKNLNRSKNTLIHIDAHSDMAAPFLVKGFPQFRWPKNEDQVAIMMQRNDVFIQASVIVGLIDHILWITPSWDKELRKEEYQKYRLDIGYRLRAKNSTTSKQFCECHSLFDDDGKTVSKGGKSECAYTLLTGDRAGEDVPLDKSLCRTVKSVTMEMVSEDFALEVLNSRDWADSRRPVMLDIDEDYFGCESGYDSLSNVGLPMDMFDELGSKINNLMCPQNSYEENCADKMLKDYFADYIKLCELSAPTQRCRKDREHLRMVLDKHIMSGYDRVHTMFCTDTATEAMSLMARVLPSMEQLTLRQLRALVDLGFCMTTSPATVGFADQKPYGVCSGAVIPNDTIVTTYTPGRAEVDSRMVRFYRILDRVMNFDLKVLTLCRSVRDGYTPRHLANMIEDGILKYFQDSEVINQWDFNMIFDDNLLGGKAGWGGRHKANTL